MEAIVLSPEDVKGKDPQFYRKLAKVKKARKKAIDKTISDSEIKGEHASKDLAEGSGYDDLRGNGFVSPLCNTVKEALFEKNVYEVIAPMPPTQMRGMEDLGELSIDAVFAEISKPRINVTEQHVISSLEEGVEMEVRAEPDILPGFNPSLDCCSIYNAMNFNNNSAEAEMIRQWKAAEKAKEGIKHAEKDIKEAENAILQGRETLARRARIKQNLPEHKRKPTDDIENEIARQNGIIRQAESEKHENEKALNQARREAVKQAAKMEAGTYNYLLQLSEQARLAGDDSLSQKAEELAMERGQNLLERVRIRASLPEFESLERLANTMIGMYKDPKEAELIEINEKYKKDVVFDFKYVIQPEEKKSVWQRLRSLPLWEKIAAGAATAATVAGAVFGIGYLFDGTVSKSEQAKMDYERFKRGQLTLKELDRRYRQGTPEFGYIVTNLMKDGFIKKGMKISEARMTSSPAATPARGSILEQEADTADEWSMVPQRKSTVARTPEELNDAFREETERLRALREAREMESRGEEAVRVKDKNTGEEYVFTGKVLPKDKKYPKLITVPAGKMAKVAMIDQFFESQSTETRKLLVTYSENGFDDHARLPIIPANAGDFLLPVWPIPREGVHLANVVTVNDSDKTLNDINEYRLDVEIKNGRAEQSATFLGKRIMRLDEELGKTFAAFPKETDGFLKAQFDGKDVYLINLGVWTFPLNKKEKDQAPLIVSARCKPESEDEGFTSLEIAVDREARKATVLPPRAPGKYLIEVNLEDFAGNSANPSRFAMIVAQDANGALWYRIDSGKPREETEKIEVENVRENGTRMYSYRANDTMMWRGMKIEEQKGQGTTKNIVPIFQPETEAGEYLVREMTRYADNTWEEKYYKSGVNDKGETAFIRKLTAEEKRECGVDNLKDKKGVLFEYQPMQNPEEGWMEMGFAYAEKSDKRPLGEIVNCLLEMRTPIFRNDAKPGGYIVRAVSQDGETCNMKVTLNEDRSTNWSFPIEKIKQMHNLPNPLEKIASGLTSGMAYKFEYRQAYALSSQWEQLRVDVESKAPVLPEGIPPGMYRIRVMEGAIPQLAKLKDEYEASLGVNGEVHYIQKVEPQKSLLEQNMPGFPRQPQIPRVPGMPE